MVSSDFSKPVATLANEHNMGIRLLLLEFRRDR
jgi:hypothetical protein